jgi:alginate O-acetyltransferase complex protein AlgI
MLFTSREFLFAFLPISLAGFYLLGHHRSHVAILWLLAASLVFYAWWNYHFVLLLLISVVFNYACGVALKRNLDREDRLKGYLIAGLIGNLGLLFYYKYFGPLHSWLFDIGALSTHGRNITLPLGISFFTFTQIGYLVDSAADSADELNFSKYALFVTFFPHLIAGPIIHHREIVPQFNDPDTYRFKTSNLAVGLSIFVIGMAKKVLLADAIAPIADHAFDGWRHLEFWSSWIGAIAFSMQIYFDFSGYSDMAIGLARMFGITFPLNFNSPYLATSVVDYWQRWHMTLTRYLTLYLYNPLALYIRRSRMAAKKPINRKALATAEGFGQMIAAPTIYTMGLAGIWHGAGLQYLYFGLLHGCYMTINHGWRIFVTDHMPPTMMTGRMAKGVSYVARVVLTFVAVLVALVFFRAESPRAAYTILAAMAGARGAQTPALEVSPATINWLGSAGHWMERAGILHGLPQGDSTALLALIAALAIVWAMPNTQQILAAYKPALDPEHVFEASWLQWRPNVAWGILLAIAFLACVGTLAAPQKFLYFQF